MRVVHYLSGPGDVAADLGVDHVLREGCVVGDVGLGPGLAPPENKD